MSTRNDDKKPALTNALERLREGVISLMSSDGWRQALEFRARLHAYSFLNTNLILLQRPDATMVAGFRRWQELGRQVNRGEKGIAILAPMLHPDPDDPDKKILTGFRTVYVFDVRQTIGNPIPEPPRPQPLTEDAPIIREATKRLTTFAVEQGLTILDDLTHPHALGAYAHRSRTIRMRPGLAPLQYLKTLVHELAHALLHDPKVDRRDQAELEAESCAFLVCHQLGLDTSAYSFAYLAHWAPNLKLLMESGDRACRAATQIQEALQPHTPLVNTQSAIEAAGQTLRRPAQPDSEGARVMT